MAYSVVKKRRLGYLLDIEYVGRRGIALLKFLDPKTQKIFVWYDKTGHTSYLLTDASTEQVEKLVGKDKEYRGVIDVERYDAVLDKDVTLRKVFAQTPLTIGGERRNGGRRGNYREILETGGHQVWEAWIRYVNGYCYDTQLEIGMPYWVTSNKIEPYIDSATESRIQDVANQIISNGIEKTESLMHWIRLFEYDLPKPRMLAVDIEVLPATPTTMPNPVIAGQPVIAVGLADSDGNNRILVLKRDVEMGNAPIDGTLEFFENEHDLIMEVLIAIRSYPVVITFNGDDFDMMYLYNRGRRLGISDVFNPIYVVSRKCKITNAIHIDLYPFMKNPSIQNYAFSAKYKDFGLDPISKGLLGRGKIEYDGDIGELSHLKLAQYCLEDVKLTLELMTFGERTTTNLILMLMRMANLNPYDITRHRIGDWVKSTFFYLLRKNKVLIPNQQQLRSKGEIQTQAAIKGKKYQGAIVHEPSPGIHFKVIVMDFASLYPTEVKERNIGYGTINCPHSECTGNLVPDTTHHICIKKRALEADVIGGLRDVRVFRYKALGKSSSYYYTLQQAIKVYINAAYGVFGNEGFGLYCAPVAEAITAYSRRDILAVIDKSIEMKIEVLGGDTDSVFLGGPTEEEVKTLQDWTRDTLKLDLGVDKVYRYAIFSHRKKNYLGIFQDGKADIKGLTGKKSNVPTIIKDTFTRVISILGLVNNMDDYERAKTDIENEITNLQKTINNRGWTDIKELSFHVRLSKDPDQYAVNSQHVKAANMLIDMGIPVKGGDIVHFVKATTDEGVMPIEIATKEFVDIDTYLAQVESIFAQIIEPMDISIDVERTADGKLVRPFSLVYFMLPKTLNSKITNIVREE